MYKELVLIISAIAIAFGLLFLYYILTQSYISKAKWTRPKIKHNKLTKWNWMVSHPDKLTLGENTDIGAFTYIQAEYKVTIGKNVQIGSHCSIYSKNTIDNTHGEIIIEDNVCIGSHTTILPLKSNCTLHIGHDSIIGACSLIKEQILPRQIYFGIPAKRIKHKEIYEHGL